MNAVYRAVLILAALAGLLLLAFLWNEARKEVVFLCGNFAPGVTEQSVIRQLDTGHFLRYRIEDLGGGRRITADSAWTLSIYQCVVELDSDGRVVDSGLR